MGYSVIPVNKDKKPLIKWAKYQKEAPSKQAVLSWVKQFPDMQLGIVTGAISGIVVIDVEAGGDYKQFPETAMVKTGGDGYHLYYKHPQTPVKNGVRVAELVDIRGDGGYVMASGSESTKGSYEQIEYNGDLTQYPVEMMQTLTQIGKETTGLVPSGERNVQATQKAGEILARLPDKSSRNYAWELLQQWNANEVEEPLALDELNKVFLSIAERQDKNEQPDSLELKPFTLKQLYDMKFPPIQWLAKDLIPVGMMGAITGESNCYKSFLTLALAQAIATGEPFLGKFEIERPGKVLIVDEENSRRIIEKRFKDMGVEGHENIVFLSRCGVQLDRSDHLESLKRVIDDINPALVVLDSLVRFHGKDENSASEMKNVMEAMRKLTTEERSVVFIHHHKKEQAGGRSSGSNSVRGSTDIFNALDCHLGIKRSENSLMISQHKLRVQQELPPFNVTINSDILSDGIEFTYGGVDTSRSDLLEETKKEMKTLLHQAAGEEMSRKDLVSGAGVSGKIGTEALKELTDKDEISFRVGAHGMHLYILGQQPEEPTLDEEEVPY